MRTMLRKVTWKRILLFLAILFIIFAGVNDRFMDDLSQQEAEKTSQRSIDHAKEKLETFNNYSLSVCLSILSHVHCVISTISQLFL